MNATQCRATLASLLLCSVCPASGDEIRPFSEIVKDEKTGEITVIDGLKVTPGPGVFRGVSENGFTFVEFELQPKGKGVIRWCSFTQKPDRYVEYAFTWSDEDHDLPISNLRRTSKDEEDMTKLEAKWKQSEVLLTIHGPDWKMPVRVFRVSEWSRAQRFLQDAAASAGAKR